MYLYSKAKNMVLMKFSLLVISAVEKSLNLNPLTAVGIMDERDHSQFKNAFIMLLEKLIFINTGFLNKDWK